MKVIETTRLILWGAALLFCTLTADAQLPATVDETSIAATYNEIAGTRGWGLLGAMPFEAGGITGNFSGIAQGGGPIIRGKYHAEAGIRLSDFYLKLYTDGTFKVMQ